MFGWKKKLLSSLDLKKQNKILNKKHNVDVATLISKRILNPNNTGSYIGGKLTISDNPFTEADRKNYGKKLSERMRDKSNNEPVEVQLPSTAVSNARFNEDEGKIFVTFVGGGKEYVFKGNKKDWLDFMNSGSKGRWVNYILKKYNQAPRSWY